MPPAQQLLWAHGCADSQWYALLACKQRSSLTAPVSTRPLNGNDTCQKFVATACLPMYIQTRRPDSEAADHPWCLIASITHCYNFRELDKHFQPTGQIPIRTLAIWTIRPWPCSGWLRWTMHHAEQASAEFDQIVLMSDEQLKDVLRQAQQEGV